MASVPYNELVKTVNLLNKYGSVSLAATALNIHRGTLYRRLEAAKKQGIAVKLPKAKRSRDFLNFMPKEKRQTLLVIKKDIRSGKIQLPLPYIFRLLKKEFGDCFCFPYSVFKLWVLLNE